VIGPKKLETIRQELRQAFAATGDDPIRWLEEQMSAPRRPGAAESSEVLQSLRRFLEGTGRKKGRKPRARTKK
jgi:hypothetical protein